MSIASDTINKLAEVHHSQYKKGIETYGTPLKPFNGRRAYNDAMEELLDLANYTTQLETERSVLGSAVKALYGSCVRFLDAPDGRAAYPRIRFSEEVRMIREDLGKVGFVMNDDAQEPEYLSYIVAFHSLIETMLEDDDEYGGAIPESAFVHVDTSIYDAEDIGEGGVDPNPPCPKCGDELEWDSGDDSVGWPGQWYCALCDREGVVEDES